MTQPSSQSQWSAGAVIGDRYRLCHLIGAGAMAEVWRAEHVTLETPLAIKLVSVSQDDRAHETLERFLREAKAAAQLRSPHVVQILDHGRQEHSAYIAMELLEGESLRHRLDRQGALEPLEVGRILSELARGLEAAHRAGIVHRDLKPENIFLARAEDREVVKILDFGIAKRLDLQGVDRLATQEGFMVGTPCYMSPEQVMGTQGIDSRSDLWQVAVVIFECMCGNRPFDSAAIGQLMMQICSGPIPTPSQVAHVPPGFDAWFAKAATRDPAGRFGSATEMAESLVALVAPHTSAAALADSLPAWVPPALASSSGTFDRSGSFDGSGTFDRSGDHPFDQSGQRLNTSVRQSWATAPDQAYAPHGRRLLLTAALFGLPLAALLVALVLVLLSHGDGEDTLPGQADVTTAPTEPAPAGAPPTPTPTPSETGHTSTASAAPGRDGGADGGRTPAPWPPRSTKPGPPPPSPLPTPPPRHQRPEDVLGI